MLRPSRQHATTGTNGYGGGAGLDLGYAGSGSYSSGMGMDSNQQHYSSNNNMNYATEGYKDKPHRKKHGFASDLLSSPGMIGLIVAGVAFLFAVMVAFRLNSKQNFLLKQFNSANSIDDAVSQFTQLKDNVETLEKRHKDAQAEAKKFKALERHAIAKAETAERLNRELLKERDELRIKWEGPDKQEEEKSFKTQVQTYKTTIKQLQDFVQRESKRSVLERFGPGPHRVRISFLIPTVSSNNSTTDATTTSNSTSTEELSFIAEMASLDSMPHSVHLFLEQVDHGLWDNAWFYVNGPHVLQCGPQASMTEAEKLAASADLDERSMALKPFVDKRLDSLAFTEYSQEYPHVQWTIGFTGRPGGPDWYINKQDNTVAHGPGGGYPGSAPDRDELGDPCFAKVVQGIDALQRVFQQSVIQDGDFAFFLERPIHIIKAVVLEKRPLITNSINRLTQHNTENNNNNNSNKEQQQQQQAAAATSTAGAATAEQKKPDIPSFLKAPVGATGAAAAAEQSPKIQDGPKILTDILNKLDVSKMNERLFEKQASLSLPNQQQQQQQQELELDSSKLEVGPSEPVVDAPGININTEQQSVLGDGPPLQTTGSSAATTADATTAAAAAADVTAGGDTLAAAAASTTTMTEDEITLTKSSKTATTETKDASAAAAPEEDPSKVRGSLSGDSGGGKKKKALMMAMFEHQVAP